MFARGQRAIPTPTGEVVGYRITILDTTVSVWKITGQVRDDLVDRFVCRDWNATWDRVEKLQTEYSVPTRRIREV